MNRDVNNHIHTTYSFSPYTPAQAVRKAVESGLAAAGIVDHDTVAGAPEFIAEGARLSLPVTAGFEMRVTHARTAIGDRRTNHPDQAGISYLVMHGVRQSRFDAVTEFLKPVRKARGERNRAMCIRLGLDYEREVLPLSMHRAGGTVTERHILFALAKGDYAELGRLKASFSDYIPAGRDECPGIEEALAFAKEHDIIAAYPYLGDVGKSVTGDKKPQAFEDGYLEELMAVLYGIGVRAVTYMPSRNTRGQLSRLRALCEKYRMMQICGEDINSPGQPFICEALRDPMYDNLREATWKLTAHQAEI
jgi:hypothetical protein